MRRCRRCCLTESGSSPPASQSYRDLADEAEVTGILGGDYASTLIEREIGPKEMTDLEAIRDFLSGPGIPATGTPERLPTRQDIYDERIDELVRRYERSNLLDR